MKQFEDILNKIKEQGLYREFKYLDKAQDKYTFIEGKKVLLLASNSYLGLCNDSRLKNAAIKAINDFGVGSGGSRLITGSYVLHKKLEENLARFKKTESCIVFNTGYMANIGTIASIADKDWVIFCDRLNHASIVDGCRLSGAKLVVYKHCDTDDLLKKVGKYQKAKGLIVTDGVFSMDGDIAPLPEIVEISKKYNLITMVDDAHATGVLGKKGSGTAEYFGLNNEIDIQMGTLSKALASEGGYVAGSKSIIDYLRHCAKSFIYSTALAPQTIAVSIKALEIVEQEDETRKKLLENSRWFQEQLSIHGFEVLDSKTPIIPVIIGESQKAVKFSNRLMEEGIFIPAIRPPTVPKGSSRLRITLMASHNRTDLEFALKKITIIGKELEII